MTNSGKLPVKKFENLMTNSNALAGNNSERKLFWFVILSVLLIYLLYPTKNFYWDGIYFSQVIEDAGGLNVSLLHPNHLFYNVIGYVVYQTTHIFGWQVRAVYVLEFISSAFGAASAAVFFFILKRSLETTYLSLTLTALFAFSATWWKFSTDADAYIPSIFFLLVAFYLLLPNQPPRPLLIALAHSSAMFLHELAVLFFPVAVLGIALQTVSLERRRRITFVLQYALTAFSLTFGTFCLSFYLLTGSFNLKNFLSWLTSYSPDIGFTLDLWKNLVLTLRGSLRLFFDGRFNFLELNLLNILLLIFLGAALIALIIKVAGSMNNVKEIWKTAARREFYRSPVTLLCAVWISTYLIFLFFFIPGNTFYRLFYFPALVLLFGKLLISSEVLRNETRQWRAALLIVVVALSNFLFFIRPFSQVRKNTPLWLALEANRVWSDKTIVYYKTLNSDNMLVRYFNPTTVWKPLESTIGENSEMRLQIISNGGASVWLETSAIDLLMSSAQTAEWLEEQFDKQIQMELTDPAYKLKFVRIVPQSSGN